MQVGQVEAGKTIENVKSAEKQCNLKQPKHDNQMESVWSGRLVSRRAALVGIGLTTCLVLATIFSMKTYSHYQNGKIENIDCHMGENINGEMRNFNYYKNAAENSGLATDQYCLAEAFKKGEGIHLSLQDARNWYKKAADQGLTLAQKTLCLSEMFPERKLDFNEFVSTCCPMRGPLSFPRCPWMRFTTE